MDLRPRKRPSEASEAIEGSQNSRGLSGESAGVRPSRTSRRTSPQKERMDTAYSGWEEPNFAHRTGREASTVPQEEVSLANRVDFPRWSGEGTGVRSSRTPKAMSSRRERERRQRTADGKRRTLPNDQRENRAQTPRKR